MPAETTTTTAGPDPFTIPSDPADIDEAYVEAVLTELEHINGDALRLAVTEGLSPRITDLITSIHSPESAALELQAAVPARGRELLGEDQDGAGDRHPRHGDEEKGERYVPGKHGFRIGRNRRAP